MTQPEQTNDSGAQQSAAAQLPKKTIRKLWIGVLALCAALVLIGTLVFSGGNSPEGDAFPGYVSPEDVAIAFNTAVSKGEVDKALALADFPEDASPTKKEAALGILREGKKYFDDKGGLERLEVVTNLETVTNEIVHDTPGRARVKLRMHFKNGQQEQVESELIWVKEKWKLRFDFD
ncbi:MAG: DUF4878 domain-containing protein [Ottowia sp.]|nr:DUF4878 domain-containing protein [Ottowia sp.]